MTSPAALEVAVGPPVVTVPFPGLEVVAGAVVNEPVPEVKAGPEEDEDEPGDADEVELSEVLSAVLLVSDAVVSAGAIVHLFGAFWACWISPAAVQAPRIQGTMALEIPARLEA